MRDKTVKYLYIAGNNKPATFTFYPALDPAADFLSLYKVTVGTTNKNFFPLDGTDLFVDPVQVTVTANAITNITSYTTASLLEGYYALVVTAANHPIVRVGYVTDDYLCPYDVAFPDYYGNFQGCNKKAASDRGLPCTSFNNVTGVCSACLLGYTLVNDSCFANTSCPSRQYYHFGQCWNASDLCGSFDAFTGLCFTCADPANYDLRANGSCTHKAVTCLARQWQTNYVCYNVSATCGNFDATTGKCLTCVSDRYQLDASGNCNAIVVICPDGQYVRDLTCITIPIECLNFDKVRGVCLACLQGYYV
jgi:hypothetical protein